MTPLGEVEIHLVESIDDAAELKRWMGERRDYVAVDTETEGLQWWRHRPRLLQVGDANAAWAIPWDAWGGAILEVLRDFEGDLVMHNATFDVHMFEHWSGVRLPRHRIHDTRPMAHVLDPTRSTGLKYLAGRLVDPASARGQHQLDETMKANGWGWDTVPIDFVPYWLYAGLDCVLTSRLYDVLRPQVDALPGGIYGRAYDLEMAASWAFMDMERKGIEVDAAYTEETLERLEGYVDQSYKYLLRTYGVKAGSNAAVVEKLMELGAWPWTREETERTPTGKPRLDADILKVVRDASGHELAEMVYQRRRMQRLCSAYLRKFLDLRGPDGRVHCSYNPLKRDDASAGYGARTGRVSISDPALQQLPRADNSSPAHIRVRNCLVATGGGRDHELLMCDFDQVEARLLASFSGDEGLYGAFQAGDFFTNLARPIYADPTIEKGDPRRQTTKTATYARMYGAQEETIAAAAGISVAEAAAFTRRFDGAFPRTAAFTRELEAAVEARARDHGGVGWVVEPLTGRRLPCAASRSYAALNYLIQGTASVLMKIKDVEMHKAGVGQHLVLNVHDEGILDVPRADSLEVARTVHGIMNDRAMFWVPITAGLGRGVRWGEKQEFDLDPED